MNTNLSSETGFSDNLRRRDGVGQTEDDGQDDDDDDDSLERKDGQRLVAHSGPNVMGSKRHQRFF